MRICCIVGTFPALSETFVANQFMALTRQGHTVSIYAGTHPCESVAHAHVVRSGLVRDVRFYNDKPRWFPARFLKFLILFPSMLAKAPGPVLRSLNFWRYGCEALSLNLFFQVCSFLEAREYDIVLCHFGQNGLVGLKMKELGALTGKLVTVFHAADISAFVRREGEDVYAELFRQGDLFLAVSGRAQARLEDMGCPKDKVFIHHVGVDTQLFVPPARLLRTGSVLRILSVARLVEKKGIAHALDALAVLAAQEIPFVYTVIGDGVLRVLLEEKAKVLGLTHCVRFAGGQDSAFVRQALLESDILLAPSIQADNGDEEGIPVILMEAMAGGVVVVASPSGAIPELVLDGENGCLVDAKDAQAMARKILELRNDPALALSLAAAARRSIEEQHDARHLDAVLEQLLERLAHASF